jgi:hypothetical protein
MKSKQVRQDLLSKVTNHFTALEKEQWLSLK